MDFIIKNLRWITLILFMLFMFKSFQSCLRGSENTRLEKRLTFEKDSLLSIKDNNIDSLTLEIFSRDNIIKDLENELKIAGVKVNAAEIRATAVQRTAEKVKSNTTIEINTKPELQDSTKINDKQ